MKSINVCDVVFRKDLYPRIEHNQQKAQEYSENLEHLPPIEVNQHNELIDGFHRWTAHKLKDEKTISVTVTKTNSDDHLLELAIRSNAAHGLQLSQKDKKKMAILLYSRGDRGADRKKELAHLLSVTLRSVTEWVTDLDKAEREARKATILDLYLKAYTAEEIGERVGLDDATVKKELPLLLEDVLKVAKVTFSDEQFQPPLYNIWAWTKCSNSTDHFGKTEQRIVQWLLYLYTNPLEIVVDPFGGGGSTLDVCQQRGRRCWISDRKPKPGMEDKLRTLDVCESLPELNKRWSEVSLVYLDPPYWRQAENQYSTDKQDLANMPLEKFTENMAGIVKSFAKKMRSGSAIALIIQPTQWKSEPKGSFTDHVFDLIAAVGNKIVTVENRVSCPYSSEQCTPQMVDWAKENKKLLVLSRELILWRVA